MRKSVAALVSLGISQIFSKGWEDNISNCSRNPAKPAQGIRKTVKGRAPGQGLTYLWDLFSEVWHLFHQLSKSAKWCLEPKKMKQTHASAIPHYSFSIQNSYILRNIANLVNMLGFKRTLGASDHHSKAAAIKSLFPVDKAEPSGSW